MALRTFVMNTVKVARNFAIALAFMVFGAVGVTAQNTCLLYTSPSPRDGLLSRMPSSA